MAIKREPANPLAAMVRGSWVTKLIFFCSIYDPTFYQGWAYHVANPPDLDRRADGGGGASGFHRPGDFQEAAAPRRRSVGEGRERRPRWRRAFGQRFAGLRCPHFSEALLRAANWELKRFNRGLSLLDTVITLAPLLGLLGTVTGMIHSFGLLGASELGAPQAITGGIAEALIATAFGLGVAILALLPFNYLNSRLEEARHEIQDAASHVEIYLMKRVGSCAFQSIETASA